MLGLCVTPATSQSLKKPIIPKEFGGKVPTAIRQRYLNMFLEECLKSCSSSEEAVEKVGLKKKKKGRGG